MRVGLVGCDGHRTGGWGHPPLHRVTMAFVGAAVLSGPSITGAPPWSPSSVMGLRPCHLLPCGAKALAVPSGALRCRWRSPHPSRLRRATFPQGKAFLSLTPAPRPGSSSSKTRSSRPGCRCGRPGTGWPRESAPPPPHTAWPRRRRTAAMASAPGRSPPPAR